MMNFLYNCWFCISFVFALGTLYRAITGTKTFTESDLEKSPVVCCYLRCIFAGCMYWQIWFWFQYCGILSF